MSKNGKLNRIIDLDRSRNDRPFRQKTEDLWIKDRNRMLSLMDKHLSLLKKFDLDNLPDNERRKSNERRGAFDEAPLLSIAIFAPSGSGKSSFLHTLVNVLNEPREGDGRHILTEDRLRRVCSLPVINPINFTSRDDFLYAFLAAALEESERKEQQYTEDHDSITEVKREFNEVSKHLHIIDKVRATDDYDPLGVSLERLERHTSGLRLKSRFGRLIAALARSLTGDSDSIIVLPVDDADLSVDRLVPTLWSYRTYLLHPQLVPVFTFTDRMAEEILRVHYLGNVSDNMHAVSDEKSYAGMDRTGFTRLTERLPERESGIDIGRHLALQFLANCFPVRNRIRLGPAPAFVQSAHYKVRGKSEAGSSPPESRPILALLNTASFLLYGHPDRDSTHTVRSALRPSTLRRQLQVLDSLIESDSIHYLAHQFYDMADLSHKDKIKTKGDGQPWVQYFNRVVWSLFNVHRDVLREFDLDLEDLYSWTRIQLRRVVLETILMQSRKKRQALLDRWRSRTDERRSQVLSVLAAEVFRPWMQGEDPVGDYQRAVNASRSQAKPKTTAPEEKDDILNEEFVTKLTDNENFVTKLTDNEEFVTKLKARLAHTFEKKDKADDQQAKEPAEKSAGATQHRSDAEGKTSLEKIDHENEISAAQGVVWFLNLAIGFYQPQILARNRDSDRRLTGIGWDLRYGPINAIRTADSNQEILSTGMMFMDPECFSKALDWEQNLLQAGTGQEKAKKLAPLDEATKKTVSKNELLLRLWSSYGFRRGRFWAAVSIWRGLGLIGRLLEVTDAWVDYESMTESEQSDIVGGQIDRAYRRLKSRRDYLEKRMRDEGIESACNCIKRLVDDEGIDSVHKRIKEGKGSKEGTEDREIANCEPRRLVDGFVRVMCELEEFKKLKNPSDRDSRNKALRFIREKQIQGLVRTHSIGGMVPRSFLGQQEEDERLYIGFRTWDTNEQKERIRDLSSEIYDWLDKLKDLRVKVMPSSDEDWIYWRDCFTRRLHGEYIVGDLMPRMNLTYIESPQEGELLWDETDETRPGYHSNAWIALERWVRVLLLYWEGCENVFDILKSCPILKPLRKLKEDPEELKRILGVRHESLVRIYQSLNLKVDPRAGSGGAKFEGSSKQPSPTNQTVDYKSEIKKRKSNGTREKKRLTAEEKQRDKDLKDADQQDEKKVAALRRALHETQTELRKCAKEYAGLTELRASLVSREKAIPTAEQKFKKAMKPLAELKAATPNPIELTAAEAETRRQELKAAQAEASARKEKLDKARAAPFDLVERAMQIRLLCEIPRANWQAFKASPSHGAQRRTEKDS